MSHYEKAVLDLLKEGPKQRKWLVKQLEPRIMSKRKLQNTLNEIRDSGKAVKVSKQSEGSGRWETWYVLPGQEYLLDVDAGRIIGAIERLKPLLLRMPTVDELAVETGITPVEARKLVYKFATQTGWYNPTSRLIGDAKFRLGEALVCAARIREGYVAESGKSEVFDYNQGVQDVNIVEDAKRFLKEHPSLLPSLSKDGEDVTGWSSEALRYLGENYTPVRREVPFCASIDRGTGLRAF